MLKVSGDVFGNGLGVYLDTKSIIGVENIQRGVYYALTPAGKVEINQETAEKLMGFCKSSEVVPVEEVQINNIDSVETEEVISGSSKLENVIKRVKGRGKGKGKGKK